MNTHQQDIQFKRIGPDPTLADYVNSFWMLTNQADQPKPIVVLPDGRIDLTWSFYATPSLQLRLAGLTTHPAQASFPPRTTIFGVNLTLLAAEYLLERSVANLLNDSASLPASFWGINQVDFAQFEPFCVALSSTMRARLVPSIDPRKRNLFRLLETTNGSITVRAMAEQVGWSSRQINRYFTQYIGLPLKAYCTILRFRATFGQLKAGNLFPEGNFTDQAHFIKDVRRFASVRPKELLHNENDRFIQFSLE